jgi:hypothetical protein
MGCANISEYRQHGGCEVGLWKEPGPPLPEVTDFQNQFQTINTRAASELLPVEQS